MWIHQIFNPEIKTGGDFTCLVVIWSQPLACMEKSDLDHRRAPPQGNSGVLKEEHRILYGIKISLPVNDRAPWKSISGSHRVFKMVHWPENKDICGTYWDILYLEITFITVGMYSVKDKKRPPKTKTHCEWKSFLLVVYYYGTFLDSGPALLNDPLHKDAKYKQGLALLICLQ